jgi:myo-inositol catabolism protein IolC
LPSGRTVFWELLADWRAGKVTRKIAIDEIVRRYDEFVTVFESASNPAATRTDA